LKDHQGNNRIVLSSGGTVAEVNHYYPFGGVFASSSNVQPYKYNGKELDTKKGLNWYDYGARHYDAMLGRWLVVDPLAEKMSPWSPYAYCYNNPIKFVDEEGEVPLIVPFLIKGLKGAAIDVTTQVLTSMFVGRSFSEAVGNIDMVSVGKSFVTSAFSMKKVVEIVFEGVDAAIDYNASEGLKTIFDEKETSHFVIDMATSLGGVFLEEVPNSFSKAISEDLSSKSAATMTKETKASLKQIQKVINSKEVKTTVSTVTGFVTGGLSEFGKEQVDRYSDDELKRN
jgi:RHS repeat-associated protein